MLWYGMAWYGHGHGMVMVSLGESVDLTFEAAGGHLG